jgi:hypothetical protein
MPQSWPRRRKIRRKLLAGAAAKGAEKPGEKRALDASAGEFERMPKGRA